MQKTILLTGATDGIGLAAARLLLAEGHQLILHGRNPDKLGAVVAALTRGAAAGQVRSVVADLADMHAVATLAVEVSALTDQLDVLINNAGIFRTASEITPEGLDVRFAVNTLAPWLLTQRLLPLMNADGRVVNLSSAAQSPVDLAALSGEQRIGEAFEAYAQSKLAITAWSHALAAQLGDRGPRIIAVNPGSMLGSKMVKEGFGVDGGDIGIGADILRRAALSEEFEGASGLYFDNDSRHFAKPHPDATDAAKNAELIDTMNAVLARMA